MKRDIYDDLLCTFDLSNFKKFSSLVLFSCGYFLFLVVKLNCVKEIDWWKGGFLVDGVCFWDLYVSIQGGLFGLIRAFLFPNTHTAVCFVYGFQVFFYYFMFFNIIYCCLVSLCFHVSCLAAMVLEILLCFLVMTDDDDDDEEIWIII